MPDAAILVRDRKTGKIVRVRDSREPAKVRVCRTCRRPHGGPAFPCSDARPAGR